MLEPGNHLGLSIESPYELGLVGPLRLDHLEGHISADGLLTSPVHDAEGAGGNPFDYLISVPGRCLSRPRVSSDVVSHG